MQDLHAGKVKGISKKYNGLYNLQQQKVEAKVAALHLSRETLKEEDLKVWHERLGHAPDKVLKLIPNMKFKTNNSRIKECKICSLARQGILPFPKITNRSSKTFQLIHVDVWGTYRVPNHDGYRFFLTIVDDCSRMVWIYLFRLKSDVIVCPR